MSLLELGRQAGILEFNRETGRYFLDSFGCARIFIAPPLIVALCISAWSVWTSDEHGLAWSVWSGMKWHGQTIWLKQGDVTYISSIGLGVMLLHLAIAVALGLWIFANSGGKRFTRKIEALLDGRSLNSIGVRPDAGLSLKDRTLFDEVCTMGTLDWLLVVSKVALCIFNVKSIYGRFVGLPERDPDELLNLASHIVGWCEAIFLAGVLAEMCLIRGGQVIVGLIVGLLPPPPRPNPMLLMFGVTETPERTRLHRLIRFRGLGVEQITSRIKMLGGWSALRLITLLDSSRLLAVAKGAWAWPGFYGIESSVVRAVSVSTMVGLMLGAGAIGILTLNCKIKGLDFVTEEFYYDWSWAEWLALLAFANNVAGIANLPAVAEPTVLNLACRNGEDKAERERRVGTSRILLVATFIDRYGFWHAWALALAHNEERWMKLFLKNDEGFEWTVRMHDPADESAQALTTSGELARSQ